MVVTVFIVSRRSLLDTLLCHVERNMDLAIRSRFCGHDAQFNSIQCMSGIAAGDICQKIQCILVYGAVVGSHSPVCIVDCFFQKLFDGFPRNRLQFKDHRAGDQSAVDFKIGILCSSSYENDRTVLHIREQIILLSFIKTVDLVNEQNCTLPVHSLQFLRLCHHFFHILFARHCGINLLKFSTGSIGNDFRQRRFAGTGRSIENDGADLVRLDGTIQKLVLADNMLLPHDLIQGSGTHSGRQWSFLFHIGASHVFKQIHNITSSVSIAKIPKD